MAKYRCKHCQQLLTRASRKAWILSYCQRAGRFVHIQRVRRRKSD